MKRKFRPAVSGHGLLGRDIAAGQCFLCGASGYPHTRIVCAIGEHSPRFLLCLDCAFKDGNPLKRVRDKFFKLQAEGDVKSTKEKFAKKELDKLIKKGLGPQPPDEIVVIKLANFIDEDGEVHKMVHAHWKCGRRITQTEYLILGYFRGNSVIANQQGLMFGFTGREVEYRDYCKTGNHTYGSEVKGASKKETTS